MALKFKPCFTGDACPVNRPMHKEEGSKGEEVRLQTRYHDKSDPIMGKRISTH